MKPTGRIVALINDRLVLFSDQSTRFPHNVVRVYSPLPEEKLKGLELKSPILYPKGELRVIAAQENNLYLAERYREITHVSKKVSSPPGALGLMGLLSQPETREVVEHVPGGWSAEFNKDQQLGIQVTDVISVGDLVGD